MSEPMDSIERAVERALKEPGIKPWRFNVPVSLDTWRRWKKLTGQKDPTADEVVKTLCAKEPHDA